MKKGGAIIITNIDLWSVNDKNTQDDSIYIIWYHMKWPMDIHRTGCNCNPCIIPSVLYPFCQNKNKMRNVRKSMIWKSNFKCSRVCPRLITGILDSLGQRILDLWLVISKYRYQNIVKYFLPFKIVIDKFLTMRLAIVIRFIVPK